MGRLPNDLRKRCGGNPELTEKLYREGRISFELIEVKPGDRVRMKSTGWEYAVVDLHPENGRDFRTDPNSDWYTVPWADDWEIIEHGKR